MRQSYQEMKQGNIMKDTFIKLYYKIKTKKIVILPLLHFQRQSLRELDHKYTRHMKHFLRDR